MIGGWIDEHWDHGFVLWHEDYEAIAAVTYSPDQKVAFMPTNPTAENMADYLLRNACPIVLKGSGVVVTKVVVWETENCFAEASL